MEERLQKLLSAAGLCSRRTAEDYIVAGRVTVNGQVAGLGDKADLSRDRVALDGVEVGPAAEPVYLMLNKPRGYVTTLSDEEGRPTVAELAGRTAGPGFGGAFAAHQRRCSDPPAHPPQPRGEQAVLSDGHRRH